ncbi:MAG: DegT/DnrJ/EryC1/StrS family aminotransferase [Candidatus Helarchaeota archaeon]
MKDYKVRFVGYSRQYEQMKSEFDAVFAEIMSGGDFIMRKQLKEFEKNIASYIGTKYAIGVNSGTDALYLSANAVGFGPGDEVITIAHTFVATVGAIVQCGAKPVLIDIDDDFNIDVEQIEAAITSRTKGIIPVHLNGHPCNMAKIMQLAEKYNLIVIEDAAQALGAKFKNKMVGSFGRAGIFSFYPAKMLGAPGDGGMVVTNDAHLARKLKALRDNGRVESSDVIECFGYCSRLDNLHAAILKMKFKHFSQWLSRRREVAKMYDAGLINAKDIILPPHKGKDFFDVYQNYVIRTEKRNELVKHLNGSGVEVLVSWPKPMHHQKALHLDHFHLPVTERISNEVLSLPMYPELKDEEIKYVIDCIHKFAISQ